MKRIAAILSLAMLVATGACGPNCTEEYEQEQECFNLIFTAYVACVVTANNEADATTRLAASTTCGNNMLAGMLGCSTQVHPRCVW